MKREHANDLVQIDCRKNRKQKQMANIINTHLLAINILDKANLKLS